MPSPGRYILYLVCLGASIWLALTGNPLNWISALVFFFLLYTGD